MNTQTARLDRVHARRTDRDRVARLLIHYPRLDEREIIEIAGFIRNGPHLDVGLLAGDERLKPHVDAFMADHRWRLKASWTERAVLTGVILGPLLLLWLFWEAFA
jgi:hypothetical protein